MGGGHVEGVGSVAGGISWMVVPGVLQQICFVSGLGSNHRVAIIVSCPFQHPLILGMEGWDAVFTQCQPLKIQHLLYMC